jgi:hypothetical protein
MRRVHLFVLPLLTGLCFVPAPAAAQVSQTGPDAIKRTEADLGTWDAVVVGRDWSGRIVSTKGVEINTLGCDGTCIRTKVQGALDPPKYRGRERAWWDSYDGTRGWVRDVQTGRGDIPYVPGERAPGDAVITAAAAAPPKGTTVVAGIPASRTSVEYPAEGRRVVTLYRQQPNGTEEMVFRITYTRRD